MNTTRDGSYKCPGGNKAQYGLNFNPSMDK